MLLRGGVAEIVFGLREGNEGFEALAGGSGVDGLRGEAHAIEEIAGAAGRDERRGGIGEDDFAVRAVVAVEHRTSKDLVNDRCVVRGVAAANGFERGAAQAEVLGRDGVASHGAIAQFGDVGFAGNGNFIEAVRAVDDKCAAHAQLAERARKKLREARFINADDLSGSPGGIRERAEKVEDGAHAEFAARGHGVARGGMHGRGKEKADAGFLDGAADAIRREINAHAELLEDVRRAAAGTERAIAVFGYANARSRDDKSRGGGNIERAGSIAAGAAGIDQGFPVGQAAGGENGRGVAAHGSRKADQFVHRLALHAQGGEKSGDLSVAGAAAEDFFHRGFGFDTRQVLFGDNFFKRFVDHVPCEARAGHRRAVGVSRSPEKAASLVPLRRCR
jgi:hypothetical protein